MGSHLARWFVHLMFRLIARVTLHGGERIPPDGAYVITSNHIGRLDAPLVYYLLGRQDVIMLVAEKYRQSAFYRWFVKQLDAIWVDRFNADLRALRTTLNRLKQGQVLVMAPEGTRSKTGQLNYARPGASYLAVKAGVPILPVGVVGTQDHRVVQSLKRLQRLDIHVYIGEPFHLPPLKGGDREEALQAYTDEIMCRIAALLPAESRGVYADHPRLQELLQASAGANLSVG
jgi:1-acyl-sn-glycerol-3-phosphate acyltransferase